LDSAGSEDRRVDERLLFNQQMTALLLGISTQAFSKWGLQPWERRGREALYYWPDVRDELVRRRAPEPPPLYDEEFLDLNQERARLARAQREKTELENAEKRGELVHRTHMAAVMGRALTAFRARLLAASSKLAPRVNPGNPNLARDLIDRELNEALAELADFDPGPESGEELAEREGDGEGSAVDPSAAAPVNGQPVGRRRKKAQ